MAVGAECDCVVFECPRGSAVPTVSGIELLQLASLQRSQNHPARSSRPSHLYTGYVIVTDIMLSLVALSAIFEGVQHVRACPAYEVAAHLLYMTGIAGEFLIGCHIAYYFTKETRKAEIRYVLRIFLNITTILLIIEMIVFYSKSPSFENSEKHCEIFYNYTFCMNIIATGIVFMSVLLQYYFSGILYLSGLLRNTCWKTPSG